LWTEMRRAEFRHASAEIGPNVTEIRRSPGTRRGLSGPRQQRFRVRESAARGQIWPRGLPAGTPNRRRESFLGPRVGCDTSRVVRRRVSLDLDTEVASTLESFGRRRDGQPGRARIARRDPSRQMTSPRRACQPHGSMRAVADDRCSRGLLLRTGSSRGRDLLIGELRELAEYLGRTWFPAIGVPQATADPKAVMIALVPARNVQMVSAASTVGVRSSADIAAPARRPPGRGRACGL
jgi:hypothetical protein